MVSALGKSPHLFPGPPRQGGGFNLISVECWRRPAYKLRLDLVPNTWHVGQSEIVNLGIAASGFVTTPMIKPSAMASSLRSRNSWVALRGAEVAGKHME